MAKGNRIDPEWLAEHYPVMTDIYELLDDHEREFGWRPTKTSVYMRANRLGLRKRPVANHEGRAERPVRWCKEPEMEQWMLEHDHGQRSDALSAAFRERWGFGLSRSQISLFRSSHDTQTRRTHGGGRKLKPVGTERKTKDGLTVIKVKLYPNQPGSKDNWKLKHVWIWEQHNGPLPPEHNVYFADGDITNLDPDNLVAVPKKIVGVMNFLRAQGLVWCDRESLLAVMALAELRMAHNDAKASKRRICRCCGREYDNTSRRASCISSTICPECSKAGRKPPTGGRRKHDHDLIRKLRAQGLRNEEVARIVGCTASTVSQVCSGEYERRKEKRRKRWAEKEVAE